MGSIGWHRSMFLLSWLICLLAGFSASCNTLGGEKQNEEGLLLAVDRFNKDLRWEDFKSASALIDSAAKEKFWDEADRLHATVRIVDYQIVDTDVDGYAANVTLRFRFYQKQNPQVQTRTLHQQWLFSEKDRAWRVVKDDVRKLMPD